jgi:prepilin-type N-terminal cleavage/methylation domain-containing protein
MQLTRDRCDAASARKRASLMVERRESGFTLVELLIVMALLGIVSVVLFTQLTSVQKGEVFERGRAEALDEMRVAMDRMSREIRQAYSVTPTPSASTLAIDTYVQGSPVHIVYTVSGTTLTRQAGSQVARPLQTGLANATVFEYEPSADNVEVVQIALAVHPPNLPDTTVEMESEVRLRNLAGLSS